MRKKRVELEQTVITAARKYMAAIDVHGNEQAWVHGKWTALFDAVNALNGYEAAELTGAGARWVEGSPETSRWAAGLAVPVQGSARHHIVGALSHVAELSRPGYTDEQLERRLGSSHQTVSSARNWLVEAGWVVDSGHRRLTRSGRKAVVWTLSEAGWARLTERKESE